MEEVKPCPFCGGAAELKSAIYGGDTFFVVCHACEIRTFLFASPAKALRVWNRRAGNE